jgi:predicted HTH transcriptional regulator
MSDDSKYIKDLVSEGEHQQQDFKFEISNAKKIAKTIVAFANTKGGRLLIGVKDNGRISGIRSDEEFYMIDAAATMYCKPEIPIKSYQRIVEGKNVLEIVIKVSDEKPHYALDDEKIVLEILKVEGGANFSFLKNELNIKKRELQNLLVNLISLKTVSMKFEENLPFFELNDS